MRSTVFVEAALVLLSLSLHGGNADLCTDRVSEGACDSTSGGFVDVCFWDEAQTPGVAGDDACNDAPLAGDTSVCFCAGGACTGDDFDDQLCLPARFCVARETLVNGVTCSIFNYGDTAEGSKGSCSLGDGGNCVPTDYCSLDTEGECVRNSNAQPRPPTPPPSFSPTGSPAVRTKEPTSAPETGLSTGLLAGLAAGGAVAIVAASVYIFCLRSNSSKGNGKIDIENLVVEAQQAAETKARNVEVAAMVQAAMAPPARPSAEVRLGVPKPVGDAAMVVQLSVLYDFEGENDDELSVAAGEMIRGLEKISDDWWNAEADDGAVGIIPSSYVMEVSDPLEPKPFVFEEEDPDF